MRQMRFGTTVTALALLAASACGGGGGAAGPGDGGETVEGKIAVLLPDSVSSDRWEQADRRFFQEAFTAAGLSPNDFIINNAEGDAATQRNQAEQAITEGAKVMLLVNLDPGSGAAIIDAAKAQGVTMIDYDRLTVGGDADYYVSGDATQAGRLQGEGLVEDLQGVEQPKIAILDGAPTDSFATDLANGYMEILQPKFDSGEYELVAHQAVPDWDGQQALTIFEQMLQASNNQIDGVIAANDTIANAVITALKARQLDLVPISGLDAVAQAVQHILAGEQSFTVYFSIKDQASLAANLAVQLLRGEEPTGVDFEVDNERKNVPTILIQPKTIRADDVADTVVADDFVSWDDVCVGEYAQFCPEDR
jgi:D-xylose transport system substrate-binding protein